MGPSSADRGQQSAEQGMPAALLECLAAMRMGAEAAFECEFVAGGNDGARAGFAEEIE